MKTICLYFEIHQNIHLKRYRFFDIGTDHYYYDDYENEQSITATAEQSYIPALQTLLQMAKDNPGFFKVAFSISGCAIELLENYAPTVIELLQELNETGCVEFLAEPYSHGLSSLANEDSFREETMRMARKVKELFGQQPKVFRNSSLIYSDDIGNIVASMGFNGVLTEGAKHVLGWKSPHFVYHCAQNPNLKLLLRDYKLSDDISLRFGNSTWSEYPLFADTYMDWIASVPEEEQVINIFMELCALGMFQPSSAASRSPRLLRSSRSIRRWTRSKWLIPCRGWTRSATSAAGWATGCSVRLSTSCTAWPTVCASAPTGGSGKTGTTCRPATISAS